MKNNLLKKTIAVVCAVLLVLSFTACATKLKGTYTSTGTISQSYTFKEDNVVVVSAFGIDAEGTYEIKDGKMTIEYNIIGLNYDSEMSFEKKGNSIFLDGVEYVKD